jgi:hypothetical protein
MIVSGLRMIVRINRPSNTPVFRFIYISSF